jgi:uncharacterized protein with HEPN domain
VTKRSYTLFLDDILDAMTRIEKYTFTLDFDSFVKNEMAVDAVIRNLEVIGEAVKNIPAHIREKNQDIPWKRMAGLRDMMIHVYFGIDLEIIWEIVKKDIPETKPEIEQFRKEYQE